MQTVVVVALDSLVSAAVLFLVSVGLTLVFGVLRILNLAHAALYALGAYVGTSLALALLNRGGNAYWTYGMLLLGAVLVGMVCGPAIERLLLRRIYGRREAIQLLLTFSLLLILDDAMKLLWGSKPLFVSEPYVLIGQFTVAGIRYSSYQALLVAVAIGVGAMLVFTVRCTRFGKCLVAVIADREVSVTLGIDVNRVYVTTFTLGTLTAALGGALIAPTIAVVPGFAIDTAVLSFAVIAIGGMGSLEGAAAGALIVGFARTLTVYLMPEMEMVAIYAIMIAVLSFRPQGLLGEVLLRRI